LVEVVLTLGVMLSRDWGLEVPAFGLGVAVEVLRLSKLEPVAKRA
jgi:hypothetical protein